MLGWVKQWGIVSHRQTMSWRQVWRWVAQWIPFGLRTLGYGMVSLLLGPLTRDRRASEWAMRRWSRTSARGLGIRWKINGLENVPAEGGYVYAANHQSLLDILVLGASLKGDFKWGAKRSLMRVPFLGWHLRLAGHVLVDRSRGTRGAVETVLRFQRILDSGKPLLLFPEGTRSPDGEVKPFKTGGFRAAVRAGVPVVPVALEGTASIMHKGAADAGEREVRERPVLICVGAPLVARPEGSEKERIADLCERVQAAVLAMHTELRGGAVLDDSRV